MVISVDVFDTALTRLLFKPTDLFNLIEEKVGRGFAKKRINAEQLARKTKPYYNFDDLYKFLPEFDKIVEINMELDNCVPIQSTLDMYKKDPKNFIFISDMYLSSDIIKKMLVKCGYENPTVFVSCEYGCGKASGELFKRVEAIVGKIEKHYGDNYKSDILGAKEAGIKAELVPCIEYMRCITEVEDSRLKKYLATTNYYIQDLNTKVARYFAPLVYAFTKWVLGNRVPGQKIFFNARDGYIPYILARDTFKAENIYYIRCSRKSVLPASIDFKYPLNSPENEVQYNRLLFSRNSSAKGLLDSINYTGELLESSELDKTDIKQFLIDNEEELKKFFKAKKEKATKYLLNQGIRENDILVDIGYYGSIQFAIQKILGINIKGYYLQSNPNALELERYSFFESRVIQSGLLLESLFSSSEEGTKGYDKNGIPILYNEGENKRKFSVFIEHEIIEACRLLHKQQINPSREDVTALTRRFIYYPTLEECSYGDEEIWENGNLELLESITNYDREKIKAGELQECYDKSYWRYSFLQRLRNDRELSYLEKYLNLRGL